MPHHTTTNGKIQEKGQGQFFCAPSLPVFSVCVLYYMYCVYFVFRDFLFICQKLDLMCYLIECSVPPNLAQYLGNGKFSFKVRNPVELGVDRLRENRDFQMQNILTRHEGQQTTRSGATGKEYT